MTEQVDRQVRFSGTVHGLGYQPIIIKGALVALAGPFVLGGAVGEIENGLRQFCPLY